ncbi:PspC domain-containing protein [Candidatus Parcubacteria bacterium]|nr:PspC domain-containing protein [Candidatus Parcubacteria bacterium]
MKKLYLSETDKKIWGVLGGLAEYFEVDSTIIRVSFVFILIITGFIPGILFYIFAALIIPKKNKVIVADATPRE